MAKKDKKIALMYDFDNTLCTKDMQEYAFIPSIGMKAKEFWEETTKLAKEQKMDKVLAYMFLMLKKSRVADKPVHREDFVKLGKHLEFYQGINSWFENINSIAKNLGFGVEHFVISSGIREIIEGCSIFKKFKEVFACEFYYDENGVACWPKNVVNYTTKTQYLFRINKGVLDLANDKELNSYTPEDQRAVPFRNMIYIGDGLTDVPCMKLIKVNGGASIAVYKKKEKNTVEKLIKDERVDFIAPADYSENSLLYKIVRDLIAKISMVDSLVDESQKQKQEIERNEKKR